jgi:predicted porin
LSGTDLIMNYDNRRNAALTLYPENSTAGIPVISYGQIFRMYEGDRSQNRARYDSPVWGGFKFAASNANTDRYAVGATWATKEESSFQVRVAAGYTQLDTSNSPTGVDNQTSISGSAMLGMGLNFTANYGTGEAVTQTINDQSNWSFKVGYMFGDDIAVAIRYMDASDINGGGASGDSIMLGAQWEANDWLDVYGGVELVSYDDAGVNVVPTEDLTIGTVGLKMSF